MSKFFSNIWSGLTGKSRHDAIDLSDIMSNALNMSNNHVMCLDLQKEEVYDVHGKALFGNHVSIEKCYTYIHPDDRKDFQTCIEEVAQGIKSESMCRYRWNYNYTGSGEPEWHFERMNAIAEYEDGRPVNIIATLTDETEMVKRQQMEEQLSSRNWLIFENSIIGLSFYTPDGWLIDSNKIMRQICNFDSEDGDAFFGSMNLFDLTPFNEVLDRNHVEEFWACSLSIVPERNMHIFLEIRVVPIYNEKGEITYLSVAARDVTEEREMYMKAVENDIRLQEVKKSIQIYEDELRYMMDAIDMRVWRTSFAEHKIYFYQGLSTVIRELSFEEFRDYFIDDEQRMSEDFIHPEANFSKPVSFSCRMHPIFHEGHEVQWNQFNSIPVYDEAGHVTGDFGVIRNITNLMVQQDRLRQETERANESGHMKSLFLANMTHEIRTPLNAIVGFSDLLQTIDAPEERREMIRIIHNNCDMLLRLVNDILVLSNVDTNSMTMELEEVDFSKEFSDICQSLAQRVGETPVEFLTENPCESLVVHIDKGRIQQVITNFVTNAVKYTQQGHIRLGYRVEERDGRKVLYVYCEDTGSGIPKNQLGKVFERFVKLNDFIQGTGLGLSICKAIIDRCGGQIGVDSEVGKGSTFWFWIPVA